MENIDLICDLCGKEHAVENCELFDNNKQCLELQNQLPLAFQTLPSWITFCEDDKKIVTSKLIKKSTRIGPLLAPQSSNLKINSKFPLYVQVSSNVRLWADQSNENTSNWLSLIPCSSSGYNLVACQIKECIYYVADKDIKVGQELIVWYAPFYKKKMPPELLTAVSSNKKPIQIKLQQDKLMTHDVTTVDLNSKSINVNDENFNKCIDQPMTNSNLTLSHYSSASSLKEDLPATSNKLLLSLPISLSPSLSAALSSNLVPLPQFTTSLLLVPSSFSTSTNSAGKIETLNLTVANASSTSKRFEDLTEHHSNLINDNFVQSSLPHSSDNSERHSSTSSPIKTNIIPSPVSPEISVVELSSSVQDNLEVADNSCNEEVNSKQHVEKMVCEREKGDHHPLSSHLYSSSLHRISVSRESIMLTHYFQGETQQYVNEKSVNCNTVFKSNENSFPNQTPFQIFCMNSNQNCNTSKNKKKDFSISLSKDLSNIFICNNIDDVSEEYDMVSFYLSASNESAYKVINKVTKSQKKKEVQKPKGNSSSTLVFSNKHQPQISNKWMCLHCSEVFTQSLPFALHLKEQLLQFLKRRFVCDVCGCHFKHSDHLQTHKKKHLNELRRKGMHLDDEELEKESSVSESIARKIKAKNDSSLQTHFVNKNGKEKFTCQICRKSFDNPKYLLRHFSKHTGDFVCSLCNKEFARKENLKKHICSFSSKTNKCYDNYCDNKYKCNICDQIFLTTESFKLQRLQHEGTNKCKKCNQVFVDPLSFERHASECFKENEILFNKRDAHLPEQNISAATTEKKFVDSDDCTNELEKNFIYGICHLHFSTLHFHQKHEELCRQFAAAGENGEVSCNECGHLCVGKTELRLHLQSHTHPYTCLVCSHTFRSRGTYEMHVCEARYQCDFCGSVFRFFQDLNKHITKHGPPPFCCSHCRYPYYKEETTQDHKCKVEIKEELRHCRKQKVPCPSCPSQFSSTYNLKKHMASAHGTPINQQFVCGKCNKRFHRSDLLKTHERIHLPPSFHCQECQKQFRNKRAFITHSLLHRKDFRFVCRYCNKKYAQKSNLLRHEKNHKQPIGTVKCQHCGFQCPSVQHLESHLINHTFQSSKISSTSLSNLSPKSSLRSKNRSFGEKVLLNTDLIREEYSDSVDSTQAIPTSPPTEESSIGGLIPLSAEVSTTNGMELELEPRFQRSFSQFVS